MTLKELAQYDGRDGRKAYVAVNSKVYDFTSSKLWQQGDHQQLHQAGQDLTEALRAAPHVRAVIERFPVVAELEPETVAPAQNNAPMIIGAAVLIGAVIFGIWLLFY